MLGAIVGSIVAGVAVNAIGQALAPKPPGAPDMAAASRAGVEAEAATLADRRRLEAAAQQGGKVTYQSPGGESIKQQFVRVPIRPASEDDGRGGGRGRPVPTKLVPYVASEWETGGKYAALGDPGKIITKTTKAGAHPVTADFTGFGEADTQAKNAQQMAELQLELSKKYGPQFIEEALKQEELANPEGSAARKKLYELIQAQANDTPERPVADLLDRQVAEQLAAGKGLDRTSADLLRQAVAESQATRGERAPGFGETATDFGEPLTTGFEGQGRLDAAQQKALGWLTSGATPEDVDYRRNQQDIGNLAAFAAGRTPQSEFSTLSGAQTGAAPMVTGRPLPVQNQNAGAAMQNAQMRGWGIDQGQAMTQANPWMAGLSTLLSGLNTAAGAGWQPLAKTVT